MDKLPNFSVITVTYNAANTIGRTIDSVLKQDYAFFEYIIIDGKSTDETLNTIAQFKDSRLKYISEPDNGIYDAMNKGLDVASGDYVIFLGSDDLFADDNVLSKVSKMVEDSEGIYYGDVIFSDTNQRYDGVFTKWKLSYKNICHQSVFYPYRVYKTHKYDISYKLVADWVYNLQLISENYSFYYLNLVVSIYNRDGLSSIKNDDMFIKNRSDLIIKSCGIIPYYLGVFNKFLSLLIREVSIFYQQIRS